MFFLIRLPFAIIGLVLHTVAIPFAILATGGVYVGHNVLRPIGAPFVFVFAALFDETLWSDYRNNWRKTNEEMFTWLNIWIPGRYQDIMTWLHPGK